MEQSQKAIREGSAGRSHSAAGLQLVAKLTDLEVRRRTNACLKFEGQRIEGLVLPFGAGLASFFAVVTATSFFSEQGGVGKRKG